MTWGLVAIAGATLVGGTIAATSASSAANKSAKAQQQGADESAQVQREGMAQQQQQFDLTRADTNARADQSRADTLGFYNTSRADTAPYRSVGQNALLALSDSMGIARPSGMESVNTGSPQFHNDPGYKFAFDEGLKAVDARFPGMSRSGAKQKALVQYGQGQADQQYGNWLSRLSSLASVGQTATGQAASLGANASGTLAQSNPSNILANLTASNSAAIGNNAANVGRSIQDSAAARASGYVGGANATSSAITGSVNNLAQLYGMSGFNFGAPAATPEWVGVTPSPVTGRYV